MTTPHRSPRSAHSLNAPRRAAAAAIIGAGLGLGVLVAAAAPAHADTAGLAAGPAAPGDRIVVGQAGFLPDAVKTIYVRRPIVGWDGGDTSVPGPTLEIRRTDDNALVMSAPLTAWNGGAVHPASGDRVWLADISALETPGRYRAVDPTTGDIGPAFVIDADPYRELARAAQRMYYYQRSGTPKLAEHAGAAWADGPSFPGDVAMHWVVQPDTSPPRDLSGGWFDAGDYNKYVNFADDVVHELLEAFVIAPDLWTDDTNIPESGNGRADLLDEIQWELDWLRRMQLADGSVLHKVSVLGYTGESPPSADTNVRYHARATATATMSVAGAFAHAAIVFGEQPDAASQALAVDLTARAIQAWDWVEANPAAWAEIYDNDGGLFSTVAAEDDLYNRQANRVRAAVHLFRLTGDPAYQAVVDAEYDALNVFSWFSMIPYEQVWHSMLLTYADLPNATPSVAADIRDVLGFAVSRSDAIGQWTGRSDAYGAWIPDADIGWGSNRTRSHQGLTFMLGHRHELGDTPAMQRDFRDAAAQYLHALHGANPQGVAFLTNLASIGIERSVNELYHGWFADGTVWDNAETSLYGPPPGYLTGGPNQYFSPSDPNLVLEPPMNQPPLKSYLDWNSDWPENSWEVTECHIPYQSAYLNLLAHVAAIGLDAAGCPGGAGPADVDCSGSVDFGDIVSVLSAWGPCPDGG
ncbi:MAG: glycoside hydrolase family 9 protein, partial [Phycisphaerales bacterium]